MPLSYNTSLFTFLACYKHFNESDRGTRKTIFPSVIVYNKNVSMQIRAITKLPNSEQSYKGKVQTHNYINRQNQSTTGKL